MQVSKEEFDKFYQASKSKLNELPEWNSSDQSVTWFYEQSCKEACKILEKNGSVQFEVFK